MTILYLVRHGETTDNAAQIMQGQTQGQLNEHGRQQARKLRDQLENEPIDVFMSSDLLRAVETAAIIAEPHGKRVETTPLLRERDWGSFTGRFIPSLKNEPWPDDIETLDHLKERARLFLDNLRRNYRDKTVLAVGHGITNKAIQAVFYDKDMKDVARMGNGEMRVLYII